MITSFENQCAQGDILIRRISSIPTDAIKQQSRDNQYIVAHSETGHHHVVKADNTVLFAAANDPMVMFLVVNNEPVLLTHLRSFDTHRPISIPGGTYEIRKQREWTPEGWRKAAD